MLYFSESVYVFQLDTIMINILELSNEILTKIFEYLPGSDLHYNVPVVCKRFQEVHYNSKFVTEILITSSGLYFGKKKIPFSQEEPKIATIKHCLLIHKQYLVKLKISNREDTEQLVQYAIENCPNLVDIEVQANEDQISDIKDSTLLEAYQWSTGNIFLRLHGLLGCEK